MGRPWLSVVMPTYNGARHLPAALGSIECQADKDLEVIAVDDGSSDDTIPILKSFSNRVSLRVVETPHTGNWVASTNRGLALAAGEWVCLLHQDDLWLERRVRALRSLLEKHSDVNLVLSPSWFIDDRGKRLGLWRCPLPASAQVLDPRLILQRLLVQNFIAVPAPIFRRGLLLQTQGLDERLWYTADWDFWLKLAWTARTIYFPRASTGFRIHGGSQTVRRSAGVADFRQQMKLVLSSHITKCATAGARGSGLWPLTRFSVELNVGLAAAMHGARPDWLRLMLRFLSLGPRNWYRYFRDSRILERVGSRIRAGMLREVGSYS